MLSRVRQTDDLFRFRHLSPQFSVNFESEVSHLVVSSANPLIWPSRPDSRRGLPRPGTEFRAPIHSNNTDPEGRNWVPAFSTSEIEPRWRQEMQQDAAISLAFGDAAALIFANWISRDMRLPAAPTPTSLPVPVAWRP